MSESPREKGEAIDDVLAQAEKCVIRLRIMAINERILEIMRDVLIAQEKGDNELFNQLTYEQIEMQRMKNELENRISGELSQ
jgi:hypothetical protein